MKKNVSRLILEVGQTLKPKGKKAFQINCQNVDQYTNKISIDANEYHKPSSAESYINQEMKSYPTSRNTQVDQVEQSIKKKTGKLKTIE